MNEQLAVLDASLVLKAILPNPEMARCQAVLARLAGTQLIVPSLWVYEVTSALAKAVYFKQLSAEESQAALRQALELDVKIVTPDLSQCELALDWTLRLNRASAYDCFYLAIADALDAPFWTADQRLFHSLQDQRPAWLHWIGETGQP